MYLFLAGLAVLFAASMVVYLIVRVMRSLAPNENFVAIPGSEQALQVVPLGTLGMPWPLWLSTVVILVSSFTMQRALTAVIREKQAQLRNMLTVTLLLSAFFILVQMPALVSLLLDRQAEQIGNVLYGAIFFLIFLHALHVIGGIVPLFKITLNAHAGKYDHEHYGPVKALTMYWHFLDVVWILMFGLLVAVR